MTEAFAHGDQAAAERVQHLQWVHQARQSRLTRTAAEVAAANGANDAGVTRVQAALAAAKAAGATLAAVHQQMTTADPGVARTGWVLHGRVFSAELQPVRGFTVFMVDAAKAYREAYGFAYTDESGYFLLKYAGGSEASKGTAAKDTRGSEVFVAVANPDAQPVYVSPTSFSPTTGSAVYQNIVLSKDTRPIGAPPPQARSTPPQKANPKT
ncbi:MAG TPA: hypothetical protein VKD69_13490 [Vicinamibacterales bacterium]|nr:hypothetical protein [Vicinamibacterales bacterium]